MDIRPIANNPGYPIYNENTQSNEINQSQRPREEIEAELAAAKEELEKAKAEKKLAEKDLEQAKKKLEDKKNEYNETVALLNRTSPADSEYEKLRQKKESLELEIEGLEASKEMYEKSIGNREIAISWCEWKIKDLESKLNPIDISDINGLPPKPESKSNLDSSKPTGLFDLLRKESDKFS